MIKLIADPTFEVSVPLTVAGHPDPVEVQMTFRHMTMEQVSAWFKANEGKPSADALDKIISGWRGVMAEDGTNVDYSKQALATLLQNYQQAAGEITRAYVRELTESRVKN
jgi:hypothetical protein